MRKVLLCWMLLLIVLGKHSVIAQVTVTKPDPIIGTWKLEVSRSKFPRQDVASPKEQTETYREVSGLVQVTITRTMTDGSSDPRQLSWPSTGGIVVVEQGRPLADQQSIVEMLIAPGDWFVPYMRKGQQNLTMHK